MSSTLRPVVIKHTLPALLLCLLIFGAVSAQTTSFTYQGRLTDAGALANGPYDIEFKLFDNAGLQQGPSVTHEDVAPVDGSFVVVLDFGDVFDGTERFLEIGVRPGDSVNEFTTLNPRWPITSTPYAIRSLKAAASDTATTATTAVTADTATDATQLGGVAADQYVKTDDPRLGGEGGNFIQNSVTPQAGANFNITGNGVVGGGLGIGIASPRPGYVLDVIGTALVTPNSGSIQFGTPNSETGISISRINNRADIRFDGGTLKLLAGPAGGPPSSANGIAINTFGNVGIGTTSPTIGKLHVVSTNAGAPAIYGESANRGVWGKSTGSSRGVYGESPNGEGVFGISGTNFGVSGTSTSSSGVVGLTTVANATQAGVYGKSTGSGGVGVIGDATTGVYGKSPINDGIGVTGESQGFTGYGVYGKSRSGGFAIGAEGNATQNRDKGGFVKAMLFVNEDGTINRCYNSFLKGNAAFTGTPLASTVPCGFSVTPRSGSTGFYSVNLGFQVDDRFVSITIHTKGSRLNTGVNFTLGGSFVFVSPYETNVGAQTANAPFMLIVY